MRKVGVCNKIAKNYYSDHIVGIHTLMDSYKTGNAFDDNN